MIGLTKQSLYLFNRGGAYSTFGELDEVLFDEEINLNNLSLIWIEDDVQFHIKHQIVWFWGRDVRPLEKRLLDSPKRERQLETNNTNTLNDVKTYVWKRQQHESLVAPRDRHNQKHKDLFVNTRH